MSTEIPSWFTGGTFIALAFVAVIGFLALAIHILRERAAGRERAGAGRRKTPPADEEETVGRVKQYAEAANSAAKALGWSPPGTDEGLADSKSRSPHEAPAAKPPKTILVADDDPVVAFALKKRLQRLGFDVLRSPDSAHALMGAMKTHPDLVVLDVNMPGGNGLAVCEMMASDPQNANIPVIVHTSRNDEDTKERCRRLGAHYVEKTPKSWEEIQALVAELLGGPETAPEQLGPVPPEIDPRLLSPVCGRPRVLCIDDENSELAPIEQRLASLGVEVLESNDLEEGFWTCFTEKPHVVVIHTHVPLSELQAALYRFTQHPVTRCLPVIVVKEKGVRTEELTEGFSQTEWLKILEPTVGWIGLWRELEKIIPIGEAEKLLPIDEAPPIDGRPGQDGDQAPDDGSNPPKILCIDDDPVIAKSIALRVRPYGIKLIDAANGSQGFYLGLRERPDLILLDLNMPEGDGHYVLSKFKNHPLTKDIPIVILTVETNAGVRRKLISLEAAGFLSKPVRWKDFFEELGRFMTLPKKLVADYNLSREELLSPV
ncbi:MAG: response regulator [Pirellulales bacterium]|nr:response regulator [Pirellulales bacterium]